MAYMTIAERLNLAMSNPKSTPMSLPRIIYEEIKEFKQSTQYTNIDKAEKAYRNRTSVQDKQHRVSRHRSNAKIEHPIIKKVVDQKANYLLTKPWSIDTDNTAYGDALNEVFDQTFRRKIASLGKGAAKSGIAWLQPYMTESGLRFARLPSAEVIPLWTDDEHTELDGFIRFYKQTVYVGDVKYELLRAELWDRQGVRRFTSKPGSDGTLYIDTDYGDEKSDYTEAHFWYNKKAYNWEEVPLIWLKYNEEELPLYYYLESLVDDVNWQTSVTADVLRDVVNFVYLLKGYGGQDRAEFLNDLEEYLTVSLDIGGDVGKLQADLNIEAVMQFLDKQRRDIYDFASAVDTKDPELGNASGTAINFRYMDLDNDCDNIALGLQDAFRRIKLFVDVYLQILGKGDFSDVEFNMTFNKDLPVNETEIIQSISSLAAGRTIASQRTLIGQLPFVDDVDEELERIEKEQQENMERFGEGLFNGQFGVNGATVPAVESGDGNGEETE